MVKDTIRITHVVRQFAPAIGGLEEVVGRLSAEQAARGHRVRVVTLDRLFTTGERLPSREMRGAVEIVRVPFRGSTKYPLAPGVLRHLGDPDLVHVHAVDFFYDFLAWTRPLHGRALIATTHGGFFHTTRLASLKRVWFATLTRLSTRMYDAVAACSPSDEKLFARAARGKLSLIENGVDTQKFGGRAAEPPRKGLVTIGRFSRHKRLDRLLDGFAALLRRDPEWRLAILGAASDLNASGVLALAAEKGVSVGVEVVENASDSQISERIARASLFVSASEYEGFGLSLVEGLSAGLLPVVHANDAFRDFQARHSGLYLTDFSQPESAADAILAAWQDRVSPGSNRADEARALALGFDWSRVATAYEQLYREVLAFRVAGHRARPTDAAGNQP